VQLYSTSLSASEVQTLYSESIGGAPLPMPELVGWWPLNGDTKDYSGNGDNGVSYNIAANSNVTGVAHTFNPYEELLREIKVQSGSS
jgi:hypothetical protein